MIRGIGIDIIEIERIAQAIQRSGKRFINKIFTSREQLTESSTDGKRVAEHYAGKFAAKEAVVKAFGTGFSGVQWRDIEILKSATGQPFVVLSGELATRLEAPKLFITISHSKTHACAFCVWEIS